MLLVENNTQNIYNMKMKDPIWTRKLIVLFASLVGKQLHIMLVDDDEDDRDNFIEAVNEVDAQVKVSVETDAVNLAKKLSKLADNLPDILFLDLNMPRKNGFECLEEIRNFSNLKSIPVFIYSTSSDPDLIDLTYDKGANLYIQKPQTFRDIKKIMQLILSLKQQDYFPQPPKSKFVLAAP